MTATSLQPPLGVAAPHIQGAALRLEGLVRDHYPFTWRVLRRFGLPPPDADDAAQQVFLGIAHRVGDILPGKERSFLFRAAMHVASRAHRSRRRRPEDATEDCGEGPAPDPSADELLDQRRARVLLDRLLGEMPEDLKAVLVLFEIEGLTTSEIAEAIDVPAGTVASRLRRARVDLAARLARHRARSSPGGTPP